MCELSLCKHHKKELSTNDIYKISHNWRQYYKNYIYAYDFINNVYIDNCNYWINIIKKDIIKNYNLLENTYSNVNDMYFEISNVCNNIKMQQIKRKLDEYKQKKNEISNILESEIMYNNIRLDNITK